MKTNNQENQNWKLWKPGQWAWKESSSRLGANGGTVGEERHEDDWVVLELAGHICFEGLEDDWDVFCQCYTRESCSSRVWIKWECERCCDMCQYQETYGCGWDSATANLWSGIN